MPKEPRQWRAPGELEVNAETTAGDMVRAFAVALHPRMQPTFAHKYAPPKKAHSHPFANLSNACGSMRRDIAAEDCTHVSSSKHMQTQLNHRGNDDNDAQNIKTVAD